MAVPDGQSSVTAPRTTEPIEAPLSRRFFFCAWLECRPCFRPLAHLHALHRDRPSTARNRGGVAWGDVAAASVHELGPHAQPQPARPVCNPVYRLARAPASARDSAGGPLGYRVARWRLSGRGPDDGAHVPADRRQRELMATRIVTADGPGASPALVPVHGVLPGSGARRFQLGQP